MSRLLKSYIKLLIESASDNEVKYADIIATKHQEMQDRKFYGDELNKIINELNKNYVGIYGLERILKQNGYSLLGNGAFRNVWSKSDVDFVIKTQNDQQDLSNQIEYNLYFDNNRYDSVDTINHDKKYYNLSIYPKLYGYDKKFGLWIIFEKVNTFDDNHISIEYFFPLLFEQIKRICDIISIELNMSDIYSYISHEQKYNMFEYIISFLIKFYKKTGTYDYFTNEYLKYDLLFSILNMICDTNRLLSRYSRSNLMSILTKKGCIINLTTDLVYLLTTLKDKPTIHDLNYGNIGYRKIKDSNQPWKSFVIIDYAL